MSRGNACCQLFVADKGFLYVVPMKSQTEVFQAVKQFAKYIGAPDAIICDGASEQKSHNLKKLLGKIGTTLRLLEEVTTWSETQSRRHNTTVAEEGGNSNYNLLKGQINI